MCKQVWDNPRVDAADRAFDKALEQVRRMQLQIKIREIFETAVVAAEDSAA